MVEWLVVAIIQLYLMKRFCSIVPESREKRLGAGSYTVFSDQLLDEKKFPHSIGTAY
jgi:hypothetical protein